MKYLRNVWETRDSALWLALIRIMTGYIFIESGWGKLSNPGFVPGMAKTLGAFASKNPYPWMVNLLNTVAIPHATFFGILFQYGEFLVGLSLFFGVLSQLGLLGALAMNITFYFAAGWTSASTGSMNLFMIVTDTVLLLSFAGKVLSVEQLWARAYPRLLPWNRRPAEAA